MPRFPCCLRCLLTDSGIAEERLLFGAAEYDGHAACRRPPPGVAGGVVTGAVGAGSVVTVDPKYVASHCAAATSLPPLLSITSVATWVGARPPALVAKSNHVHE